MVHTAAVKYQGRFTPNWLENDPHPELEKQLPAALVRDVLRRDFVGDVSEFHAINEEVSQLRRFTHNPLTSLPVVAGIGSELLVPVPGQVIRKISPVGIWYAGWDRWGASFAEDVGDLFEQYVGRLLRLIPDAAVYPEIKYGTGDQRTVDWIVACKHAVLLVEVKSARPTNPVRQGTPDAWPELATKLGRAYEQIGATDALIGSGDPAVSHIPANLPRLGLIVTMEPFAFTNANPIRQRYGAQLTIPTSVCSSYDLEWLVRLKDLEIDNYLLQFLTNQAKEGWEVTSDLVGIEMGRNQVLDQGWDSYTWGRPPEQETTFPDVTEATAELD